MITYRCDRCTKHIPSKLRITITQDGDDRHFCGPNCLNLWIDDPATVTATAHPKPTVTVKEPKAPVSSRDAVERTCTICGRVGTRRFIPIGKVNDDGTAEAWRCAPSATKCPGNDAIVKASTSSTETVREAIRVVNGAGGGGIGTVLEKSAQPFQGTVYKPPTATSPAPGTVLEKLHTTPQKPAVATQAERQAEVAKQADAIATAAVTARCQDCTRTWTLTGRVLQMACEMHEQKHSHIVDNYEETNDR